MNDYTLFYCAEDGRMRAGYCREENEALIDVRVGEVVDIDGYRGDGLILTLTGLNFSTSADIALVVPGGTTIVLEREENRLAVYPTDPLANVAVLYSQGDLSITGGEGKLFCDASNTKEETCSWSRCVCVRYGDLTIDGGCVEARCGLCSRRAGAIYAGGRLFGGDNQKGAITITGGTVIGHSIHNVVRATEGELAIGAGACVDNAVTGHEETPYVNNGEEWHGGCLSQGDKSRTMTITFNK